MLLLIPILRGRGLTRNILCDLPSENSHHLLLSCQMIKLNKMNLPKNVINPFSEKFLETWELWKEWRKEFDKFKYKGIISEQMALKTLVELSDGQEEKAVKIIEQSIGRGWTGFYKVKNLATNGKSKKSTSNDNEESGSLTEQAINEFNRRNGIGGQQGDNSHLKAV
jgi:hypothetical protein